MSAKIVRMRVSLARILGTDIADAIASLPACSRDSPELITADIAAEHVGRVRLTFKKFEHRHRRNVRWFWTPERAELL